MQPFIDVFEFVLNNFIVVGIIVLSITLFFLVVRMFYLEYRFNKHLSMRKLISRNLDKYRSQQLTVRRFLGLALPIALIVLIVIQALSSQSRFEENSVQLESEEDIIRIYEDFFGKFLTTPIQPNIQLPTELSESARMRQTEQYENIDFVVYEEQQLFVLNAQGVDVVRMEEDIAQHHRRLPLIELSCEAERFVPEGMFVYNGNLVVLVSIASNQCDDRVLPFHLLEHRVEVFVFDISDDELPLIEHMMFSGLLSNVRFQNEHLTLSTTTYLAFTSTNFSLQRAQPSVRINETLSHIPIDSMRYVKGTVPNSFVAIHHLDLATFDVVSGALLTDVNHRLNFTNDGAVIVADSYLFAQASELFELRNPVERIQSAITLIAIEEEHVTYRASQILDGELRPFSLHTSNEEVILITRETIHYRIHRFNDDLDIISKSIMLPRFVIDDILYDQNHLYFIPLSPTNPILIFGLNLEGDFEQRRELENVFLLDYIKRLSAQRILAASNLQNNMINVNLIQQSNPRELSLSWQDIVDYTLFGYRLEDDRNPLQEIQVFAREEQELLLLPLQSSATVDLDAEIQTAMLLFEFNDERLSLLDAFRLGGLEAFRYPFSYRGFQEGEWWWHVTPGGVVISPIDALSQRTQTIRFHP